MGLVKVLQMKYFSIFVASKGGLAQLARAFDWQSKGHRFDSDILHLIIKTLQRCKVFFISGVPIWSAL